MVKTPFETGKEKLMRKEPVTDKDVVALAAGQKLIVAKETGKLSQEEIGRRAKADAQQDALVARQGAALAQAVKREKFELEELERQKKLSQKRLRITPFLGSAEKRQQRAEIKGLERAVKTQKQELKTSVESAKSFREQAKVFRQSARQIREQAKQTKLQRKIVGQQLKREKLKTRAAITRARRARRKGPVQVRAHKRGVRTGEFTFTGTARRRRRRRRRR